MTFDSVDSALRALEPIDVSNGEYVVYDATGRLCRLGVRDVASGLLQRTVLEEVEDQPSHAAELRSLLLETLGRIGRSLEPLCNASLSHIVDEAHSVLRSV